MSTCCESTWLKLVRRRFSSAAESPGRTERNRSTLFVSIARSYVRITPRISASSDSTGDDGGIVDGDAAGGGGAAAVRGGGCAGGVSTAGLGGCATVGVGVAAGVVGPGVGVSVVGVGAGKAGFADGGGVVTVTAPGVGAAADGLCGAGGTVGCDAWSRGSVGRGCGCACGVGRAGGAESCGFGGVCAGSVSGEATVGAGGVALGSTGGVTGDSEGPGAKATRDEVSDQRLKPANASAMTATAAMLHQSHDRLRAGAASVSGVVVDRRSAAGITWVRDAATSEPDSRSRRIRLSSASRSEAC